MTCFVHSCGICWKKKTLEGVCICVVIFTLFFSPLEISKILEPKKWSPSLFYCFLSFAWRRSWQNFVAGIMWSWDIHFLQAAIDYSLLWHECLIFFMGRCIFFNMSHPSLSSLDRSCHPEIFSFFSLIHKLRALLYRFESRCWIDVSLYWARLEVLGLAYNTIATLVLLPPLED